MIHEQRESKKELPRSLTDRTARDIGLSALDQAPCNADPMVKLGDGELQFVQPLGRSHVPNLLELHFLGELAKGFSQLVGVLLGDETQEVGKVQHSRGVVDLVHTVGDVGRDVDQADELHFFAARLDNLGNFVGNDSTVRVTREGVGSVGLDLLHSISVASDHLLHGGEDGLVLIETAGTEGIEGALSIEVLGEVDEDQNFADTRVNEENGCLVAGGLEGNDGVVNIGVQGRGVEDLVDQGGEEVGGRVQQDAEDGDFVGKLHGHLDFALEPM